MVFLLSLLISMPSFAQFQTRVIYGEDNREEIVDLENEELKTQALSVGAIIPKSRMELKDGKFRLIPAKERKLCKNVRFREQPSVAQCTFFLTEKDEIMTAGHCISSVSCENYGFIFDYQLNEDGEVPEDVPEEEVYYCEKVKKRKLDYSGADYAIVKLDRPVEDREPLELYSKVVENGDPLYMIGHSAGRVLKHTDEGNVSHVEDTHFDSDLDAFSGNSGSPIFSEETGEVAGILVRGESDYKYISSDRCYEEKVCEEGQCRGESATAIDYILNSRQKPVEITPL